MLKTKQKLINALNETIERLSNESYYSWTNQGGCICGHLAQTITKKSKAEIHSLALEKAGDWSEKVIDYCPSSGYPIDHIISSMIDLGLSKQNIINLERLSDKKVLKRLSPNLRPLDYKNKDHVILYMKELCNLLKEEIELQYLHSKNTKLEPVKLVAQI